MAENKRGQMIADDLFGKAPSSSEASAEDLFPEGKKPEQHSPQAVADDLFGEPESTLLDNPMTPFKAVPSAVKLGVSGLSTTAATVGLEREREGGSVEGFVQGIKDRGFDPISLARNAADEISRELSQLMSSPESIQANTAKVRDLQTRHKQLQAEAQAVMPPNPSFPLQLATDVTTNVAQNLPGLGLSIATGSPLPALASGSIMAAGQAAETPLLTDPDDPEFSGKTRKLGTLMASKAVTESALEMAPLGTILDALGTGKIKKFLGKYILQESGTEMATTAVDDFVEHSLAYPEQTWRDFVMHNEEDGKPNLIPDVAYTALVAPLSAGIMGGAAHLVSKALTPAEEDVKALAESPGATAEDLFPERLDLSGQSLNQSTPNVLPTDAISAQPILTPEVEAAIADPEPMSDEALDAALAALDPPPPSPELANQGNASIGIDDADLQIGMTRRAMKNAGGFAEEDKVPLSQMKIEFGPEALRSQPVAAVAIPEGTVVGVSGESDAFINTAVGAVVDAYQTLMDKYGLKAKVIVDARQGSSRYAIGSTRRLMSGEYVITPAEMRQFDPESGAKLNGYTFNTQTQAKVMDNIAHEFGHILKMERFLENVPLEVQEQFFAEGSKFSPDLLAKMPQAEQGLMHEYLKARNLKGVDAATWQLTWMSPAHATQRQWIKEVGGFPGMNAESFVRLLVGNKNRDVQRLVRQLKQMQDPVQRKILQEQKDTLLDSLVDEYLSFDEYVAEQMARHTYADDTLKGTKAASSEFFGGGRGHVATELDIRNEGIGQKYAEMMKSLRAIFVALKKGLRLASGQTYKIKAGVSFEAWLDSLSQTGRLYGKGAGMTALVGEAKAPEPKADYELPDAPEYAKDMRIAVTRGRFSPAQKKVLYGLIREGSLHTARLQMIEYLKGKIKFQLDLHPEIHVVRAGITEEQAKDPVVRKQAEDAWNSKGFESPFWTDYFGKSVVVDAKGQPMKVYHATPANIDTFNVGDIGYHVGDVLAAHARIYKTVLPEPQHTAARQGAIEWEIQNKVKLGGIAAKNGPDLRERVQSDGYTKNRNFDVDWNILELYAAIENPIKFSERFNENIWSDPVNMANFLQDEGYISFEEKGSVWQAEREFWNYVAQHPAYPAGILGADSETIKAWLQLPELEAKKLQHERFNFLRDLLVTKGYDGMAYENWVEGGISYVAFSPDQIKLTGNKTVSKGQDILYQRDVDPTTPTGHAITETLNNIDKFLPQDPTSRLLASYEDLSMVQRGLKFLAGAQYYMLQTQQIAHIHPEFLHLELYNAAVNQYHAMKSRWQMQGEKTVQMWKGLAKENDAMLSRALEAEAYGGKHWTKLTPTPEGPVHILTQEALDELAKHGLNDKTRAGKKAIEVYLASKNVLTQQLTTGRLVLLRELAMKGLPPKEALVREQKIKKAFKELIDTPFLPRGDYGPYGLKVVAYENGARVVRHQQMFESVADKAKGRAFLMKNLKEGETIEASDKKLSDEQRVLLGVPQEIVTVAADLLDLTESQSVLLNDLLRPVKMDKLLVPYERALAKISGGSKDRARNFADFIWHNSTLMARAATVPAINRAMAVGRNLKKEAGQSNLDALGMTTMERDLDRSLNYMEKTTKYMLSPPNEWYTVRSALALIYLWASPKTAAVNLTGISISVSALQAQYGDIAGNAALAKAHKQLVEIGLGKPIEPMVLQLYNKAMEEGFLEHSYAAHLAGAATVGMTHRMVNRSRWTSQTAYMAGKGVDLGMLPFTLAEQYTRRITFLAQANALIAKANESKETLHMATLYAEAVRQTDILQNSYTLANRPVFMRGHKTGLIPLFTIFMSYTQHALFNSLGGYTLGQKRRGLVNPNAIPKSQISATKRLLLYILVLGGIEALPFAGNLFDMLDVICYKLWGKSARQLAREGIRELPELEYAGWVNNPRAWTKGMGGDFFGTDISGAVGMGRPVPGTSVAQGSPSNSAEVLGRILPDLGGVAGNLIDWSVQLGIDAQAGNDLTKNFMKFPGEAGALYTMYQWGQEGVRGTQGELLYEPSTADLVKKGLNFNPVEISKIREENWAEKEAQLYWTKRRSLLLKQYYHILDEESNTKHGVAEGEADALARIDAFNEDAPDNALVIYPQDLTSGYRRHVKEQFQREMGIADKNVENLTMSVEESFQDPDAAPE